MFEIMHSGDNACNIMEHLTPDEASESRKLIIEMILATDMSKHFDKLNNFNAVVQAMKRHAITAPTATPQAGSGTQKQLRHLVSRARLTSRIEPAPELTPRDRNDMVCVLEMCLHTADISNPAKPLSLARRWTALVVEEFFRQGDMERDRGLPITQFFDRHNPSTPKQQIGFIDFIIDPTFAVRFTACLHDAAATASAPYAAWRSGA